MAHFGRDFRIDKKGAIDLVTDVDVEIEREFRAMIAERFPDHAVLGEEFGAGGRRARSRITAGSSTRSTARRTTRTACRSSARRWRSKSTGEPVVAAMYDPNRQELFTAERGQGALAERPASARLGRGSR